MDHGKEALCLFLLVGRKLRNPLFKDFLCHVLWIEICPERFASGHAWNESFKIVDVGPWTFVNPKIVQARLAERSGVFLQASVYSQISRPQLSHENIVQNAGRLNQLHQGFLVTRRKF